eukprot:9276227-Pyramimonas_sp.AAC.1
MGGLVSKLSKAGPIGRARTGAHHSSGRKRRRLSEAKAFQPPERRMDNHLNRPVRAQRGVLDDPAALH